MQHNRLIMLRLIASRLGATWKVRAIVADTTSLPQMLNTRDALLALADASDVIEVPTALVLRCTSFSSTLAARGFRGAYQRNGGCLSFLNLSQSNSEQSSELPPDESSDSSGLSAHARNLYLYAKQMYHVE